jgi:hypothetical protein
MFAIVALAFVAGAAGIARAADDDPWQKGSNWMSFSAGYAKNTLKDSPSGNLGVAVSYARLLSPRFGVGATVGHNLVEQRGAASLIEIPMTLDYTLYFRWKTGVSPLLGFGFGGYYRKMYRTGDDMSEFSPGGYFRIGLNAPVDHRTLIGLEYKVSSISSDFPDTNPAFGDEPPSSGRTNFMLSVTRVYW